MNGVPLIGQQPTGEQIAMATYRNVYLSLIPIVAAKLMDRDVLKDPLMPDVDSDTDMPDRIARDAEKIAIAVMRRMGINIAQTNEDLPK
jgi:hypothetical protein